MALLNTWASQQDQATLSPLSRLLNNYIQKGDAPLAYLMRGDAQGLLKDLNTPKPVNTTRDMTDLALNLNPVMGLIGATAFHGSPYLFDKFNINKVGTGEGAQAYGHGMYFAENPKVAEDYAKKLAIEKTSISQLASDYLKQDVPPSAIRMLHDVAISSTPIEEVARKVQGGSIALRNESPDTLKNIVSNFRESAKGIKYKVDIPDTSIPKMLEWNKPLSEQTDEVKKALSNLPHRSKDWTFKDTLETLNAAPHTKDIPGMNPTGQEIYSLFGNSMMIGNKAPGQQYVSDLLSKQGIKGIKYLDATSRGLGTGTNNFVVFDPSEVKILEKGLLK